MLILWKIFLSLLFLVLVSGFIINAMFGSGDDFVKTAPRPVVIAFGVIAISAIVMFIVCVLSTIWIAL